MTPDQLAAEVVDLLPGGPLVVALGGGADSAVAAWAAGRRGGTRAVFVRHGLEDSAVLETAAREVAEYLHIDLAVIDGPVEPGPSLESRARDARWRAIATVATTEETIVTGHTQDDQAETVLMNLMRGAGNSGLAGMLRGRPGVSRPLLDYSRSDIRRVGEELNLPFVDDPSNVDATFLRNRIRLQLIPDLDTNYRAGVRSCLARAGALAAADDEQIEILAASIPVLDDDGAVLVPSAPLVTVGRPVAARAVRRALRRLLDPYAGTEVDVDTVLAVAAGTSEPATVTGSLLVTVEGPFVVIDPGSSSEPVPGPLPIGVPGTVTFGIHQVTFAYADRGDVVRRSTLLVDRAAIGASTELRSAAEGDRIDIAAGSKSVRTVLSEAGIAVRHRSTWPVVVDGATIAAIVGVRVASWARPTTRHVVAIGRKQVLA